MNKLVEVPNKLIMQRVQMKSTYKPVARVLDARSYSHNRTLSSGFTPQPVVEEPEKTPLSREPSKNIQQISPSIKPSLDQQFYKEKIEQIESRLNEENQYLRQATGTTIEKLKQANQAITKLNARNADLQKEIKRLINNLELQNGSSKELTEIVDKMRKENTLLNIKLAEVSRGNGTIKQQANLSSTEGENKTLRLRVKQLQVEIASLKKQLVDTPLPTPQEEKTKPKEYPSGRTSPTIDLEKISIAPETSKPFYSSNLRSERKSFDRTSGASRDPSKNSARHGRSASLSNFMDSLVSPKESARMEVLSEEIGVIKDALGRGEMVSLPIVNKLFSMIQHLTNALNNRNQENSTLKIKLKQKNCFGDGRSIDSRNFQRDPTEFSPNNNRNEYQSSLVKKHRSVNSYDSLVHSPPKNSAFSGLQKPRVSLGSSHRDRDNNVTTRNTSIELREKYDYVYRKIELRQYLERKIDLTVSMELVKRITDVVEKQLLGSPRMLEEEDFYVLYCEGECPNSLRVRVELRQRTEQGKRPVTEAQMMQSLGRVFGWILNAIKIESFDDQKLYQKVVNPAFNAILNSLATEDSEGVDMKGFKEVLSTLKC